MVVDVGLTIAVGVTLAWYPLSSAVWLDSAPVASPRPVQPAGSRRLVAAGEVLFATPVGRQSLGLDCLLDPGCSGPARNPVGEPVHVRVRGLLVMPSLSLHEVVVQWLERESPVRVDLLREGATMRARISKGWSVAVLDVENGAAVERRLAAALRPTG